MTKTLFEIPIYAMSKSEFDKRWVKKKAERFEYFMRPVYTESEIRELVDRLPFPKTVWKYNQIIGYIIISISSDTVWFDVSCTSDTKFYADSKTKHFITNWSINGCHFYVGNNFNNDSIKQEIREWLEVIETDHLNKRFFVDYEVFNNVIDLIDICDAMQTVK